MSKILVIAVHPDDETLGCGGTLLRHKARGDEVHWMIATDIKEVDGFERTFIEKREKEIKTVAKLYDFNSVLRLGLSATKVDEYSFSYLITEISNTINKIKPDIIYLPFKSDVQSDHRFIFYAAYSCTKSFRYPFIKKIYMIETLSETEFAPSTKEDAFIPNSFVDISKYLDKKIEIMTVYESEIGVHPFPRSKKNIKALGVFRGASAGCEYAEAFVLLKEIK
ncbi:MAG: PIG-L family deacetylase [Bacteroidetes bacterium]|nr:PIG-L family deacetylase [Bacteroidota bacterium]